ncbi:MAG: rhodanese-like domain-containing protein [Trueperaceae bacterium]|nr:rhodanese-like domain-containing protein [Trueperaceae bacterium]
MIRWLQNLLSGGVEQINVQEAQERVKGGAILVDVREPYERKVQYIPGSKALPLSEINKKWQNLPKDKELIIQCRTGNRSARAASFLAKQGLQVKNMRGGLLAWQAEQLPVRNG